MRSRRDRCGWSGSTPRPSSCGIVWPSRADPRDRHALPGGAPPVVPHLRVDAAAPTDDQLEDGAQPSVTLTAWITTPTRPPTTVPLIRMNCRSRPTCSSIRRAASRPSQRSMVWVITAVTSAP